MGGPSASGKSSSHVKYKKAEESGGSDILGMDSTPKSWYSGLSDTQKASILAYTGNSYKTINSYLRGTNKNELNIKDAKIIKDVSNILGKAKLKENITVYRGASIEALGASFKASNYKKMKGAIIKDKGFMSTTLNKNVTSTFSSNVTFEIRAKKGTHAAYIRPLSKFKNEQEVLFNKGTKLHIQDIQKDGKKYRIIADVI